MLRLRHYQQNAIEQILSGLYEKQQQGVFLCLPTAGGKTVIFTEVIKRLLPLGKKVAVIAHRQELIQQAGKTIDRNGMQHGIIKAGPSTFPLAPIQVCSIDSLRNRELPFHPDLIILDEAHLSKAERYTGFLSRYPEAKRLLVSATPVRSDGSGFNDIADELILASTITELLNDSEGPYLVPPLLYRGSQVDLSAVKTTAGDYNKRALETVMSGRQLVGDVVKAYQEKAAGRKGVVFCTGVEHSKKICERFNLYGIRAMHIDGTYTERDREMVLSALRDGSIQIVTNANVLCEGWDEPSISYVGLARPTKSLALYIQMAGRGLRLHGATWAESLANGKKDCVIIDHGNNVEEHGHILEERRWSLFGTPPKPKKKHKECPNCGAYEPLKAETCRSCGFVWKKREQKPVEEVDGTVELVKNQPMHPTHREYAKLLRWAKAKGYKPGKAWFELLHRAEQRGDSIETIKQVLTFRDSRALQAEYYYS